MPVTITTVDSTMPKYKLSATGSSTDVAWIKYATKHKTAPIHSSRAKPPKRFLQNLIHSGVCLGGVRAFGPSLSKFSFALAWLRPWWVENSFMRTIRECIKDGVENLHCQDAYEISGTTPHLWFCDNRYPTPALSHLISHLLWAAFYGFTINSEKREWCYK